MISSSFTKSVPEPVYESVGKWGQICTVCEVKQRKSARNRGIGRSEPGETAVFRGSRRSICVNSRQNSSSHVRVFELKRGEMRANELADGEHHANRRARFFLWTGDGFERDATRALTPEFTQTVHNTSLLERFFRLSMVGLLTLRAKCSLFAEITKPLLSRN